MKQYISFAFNAQRWKIATTSDNEGKLVKTYQRAKVTSAGSFSTSVLSKRKPCDQERAVREILELESSNEAVKQPRTGIVSFELKVKFRTTHVISLSQFILPINQARNCFHLSVDQEISGARISCLVRRKTTSISFFLRFLFRY